MYEIELKAHIYNREETIKILNTFANYVGFFQKHDSYYKLQKQNSNDFISVRIRKELSKQEQNISEKIYLTYKQKELKRLNQKQRAVYYAALQKMTIGGRIDANRKLYDKI